MFETVEDRAMDRILQSDAIAELPVSALSTELEAFLKPVLIHLPEERLREAGRLIVQGILGSQSPLISQMARAVVRENKTIWPTAKRFYRFLESPIQPSRSAEGLVWPGSM
jgi:hypothetical protein